MAKAPYRVPVGHAALGGLRAFPLRNFLKFGCSKVPFGGVWEDLKRQNCTPFAQLYLPPFPTK